MDENRKSEIMSRLVLAGYPEKVLTPKQAAKLDALDKAVTLMNDRREKAIKLLRENEVTGANIERVLAELGGETITDQTLNKTALYHDFIGTYKDAETFRDIKEQVKRLREDLDEAKRELTLLHSHDADYQEMVIETDALRKRNVELEADKRDMEIKLARLGNKMESARKVKMQQIEIPVDNNSAKS